MGNGLIIVIWFFSNLLLYKFFENIFQKQDTNANFKFILNSKDLFLLIYFIKLMINEEDKTIIL